MAQARTELGDRCADRHADADRNGRLAVLGCEPGGIGAGEKERRLRADAQELQGAFDEMGTGLGDAVDEDARAEAHSGLWPSRKSIGHFKDLGVEDRVLPQAIFAPAVAVIGTDDGGGMLKCLQQGSDEAVGVFEAGALPTAALGRVVALAEGNAGIELDIPVAALKRVGHMRFADVQEHKRPASGLRKLFVEESQLRRKRPGSPAPEEPFEVQGERPAGVGIRAEPTHTAAAKGGVANAVEAIDDIPARQHHEIGRLAGNARADQLEELRVLRVDDTAPPAQHSRG